LDYFTVNCVDDTMELLRDDIIDRFVVTILPARKSKAIIHTGGATHVTNVFDKKFDYSRPPRFDEIITEITICNDIESLVGKKQFRDSYEKRFFEFIESLDIEVNIYSMFTITLLHEIGHANLVKLFLQLGMEKEFDNLYHMAKTTVMVTGSSEQNDLWNEVHKISLGQTTDVQENFSDAYALKNFPKVWNAVKHYIKPELKNKSIDSIIRYNKRFKESERKYVTKPPHGLTFGFDKIMDLFK